MAREFEKDDNEVISDKKQAAVVQVSAEQKHYGALPTTLAKSIPEMNNLRKNSQ